MRTVQEIKAAVGQLPLEERAALIAELGARKKYPLWQANAFHPSLHFKSVGRPNCSARVGDDYRAIGQLIGEEFVWEWIGSHADYDKRL